MKTFLKWTGLALLVLGATYWFGPTQALDDVRDEPVTLDTDLLRLEQGIADSESRAGLKPDNQARIIWADSTRRQKTPYSLVYLHGFGASWAEGDPVHRQLAARFGANLYLARLHEHGIRSPDALRGLTPANYVASAERALAIGHALGDKVILIGTSAGGMLTLYLAARHPDLHGLVLYSPCVAVANPALQLATKPWGKQLLDQAFGGEHVNITRYSPERARYWLTDYHTNGLLTLQTLIDRYMTADQFAKVKQPLFLGYYYADDAHQDKVVSVPAMLAMYEQLGTPASQKKKVAFPKAGEHVIASHFTSQDLPGVYGETERFLREVLKLTPVTPAPKTPAVAFAPKK